MFECFGRKWAHRRKRRFDRWAMASTLRDVRPEPAVFIEAWREYRQEGEHWTCACAKADGCAVSSQRSET